MYKKIRNDIEIATFLYICVNFSIYLLSIYLLVMKFKKWNIVDEIETLFVPLSLCRDHYEPESDIYPSHACLYFYNCCRIYKQHYINNFI